MDEKVTTNAKTLTSPEEKEPRKSVVFANEKGEIEAWDDYWEDMLRISRGPRGWNIGCA